MSNIGQPYLPTGPDLPPAPLDVPIPSIPPASFQTIASDMTKGSQSAGFWDWLMKLLFDWLPQFAARVVGGILAALEVIVAKMMGFIFAIFFNAKYGTDAIAATVLGGIWDIQVNTSDFTVTNAFSGRAGVATQVVNQVLSKLTGGTPNVPGGIIGPSQTNANNFMQMVTHMAIEGWLSGWLVELGSMGQLETFTDLKDILERSMGLGRMSRAVLHPMVNEFCTKPLQYLINQNYRPAVLNPNELVREYIRGQLQQPDFQLYMGWHGYTAAQQAAIVNLNRAHLTIEQLVSAIQHGHYTQQAAVDALAAQGYDTPTATEALFEATARIGDSLALENIHLAAELVAENKLDQASFLSRLTNSNLPQNVAAAVQDRVTLMIAKAAKRPSIGEGATLVKKGLWNVGQYTDLLTYYGYNATDALDMELLVVLEETELSNAAAAKAANAKAKAAAALAKQQAAAAKATAAAAAVEDKGVSIASYKALVAAGLKTLADYQNYLTLKGIAPDNVNALVQLEQQTLSKAAAAAAAKPTQPTSAAAKGLSVSQLEASVIAGDLTMAAFASRLQQLGYDATDAQLIVDVLQDKITAAANKAAAVAAAKAAPPVKHVNLAQYEHGVRIGLHTLADYTAFLQQAGYDAPDVTLLTAEMQDQLAKDAAAAAAKSSVSSTAAAKGLNLSQLERAVRAGLATMADYTTALANAGYTSTAQSQLASLLQLQIDNDKATLAASGRAAALLGQRGLSLADTERAVKLGVTPIANYTSQLIESGLSQNDAQLLTLALSAQLASVKKTTAKAPSISSLLTAQGLSLSRLETDVRSGLIPMSQFTQQLQGAGVSQSDITTIENLLSEEINAKAAAAALHLSAAEKAARAGLSLAQEEAAVKAGALSLNDYATFITNLGYSQQDVTTLVNTLAASSAYQKLIAAGSAPGT